MGTQGEASSGAPSTPSSLAFTFYVPAKHLEVVDGGGGSLRLHLCQVRFVTVIAVWFSLCRWVPNEGIMAIRFSTVDACIFLSFLVYESYTPHGTCTCMYPSIIQYIDFFRLPNCIVTAFVKKLCVQPQKDHPFEVF